MKRMTLVKQLNSPFLRWAGEWVESVNAKHGGADLGDAIIWDEHKCDQKRYV